MKKKIQSALVSVFSKDNLEPLLRELHKQNVKLISTGGTQQFIESLGLPAVSVESITDYPSILGGRVKTLHPKVFGGILRRDDNATDKKEIAEYKIPTIDLVIVDLYPFEETLANLGSRAFGEASSEAIEKIDIGGISLIRAAAKNFNDVLIIPSGKHYSFLLDLLKNQNGESTLEDRKLMAGHAFNVSSHYDGAIFRYFNHDEKIPAFKQSILDAKPLRYGENPHQRGVFYGKLEEMFDQIHGREISYNNLLDIDAAVSLMSEFSEPTCAILKHNNACGVASGENLMTAWENAYNADPLSAFGGIIIVNGTVDEKLATAMNELFFEVLIAPSIDEKALKILQQKKNRIILIQKKNILPSKQFRSLLNGAVEQDRDLKTETKADMKPVTAILPTEQQLSDLEFANKIVKHTKSNTIVLVKNKQMIASGTGQTSRVDALNQAIQKAQNFNLSVVDAVMASDAFFPFPDCVEIAGKAGIRTVIQPGGSVKDQLSIDYCNSHNIAMVFTGVRHFKH